MVALRVEQLIKWCSFVVLTGVVYGDIYVPPGSYGNLVKGVQSKNQIVSGDVKSIYELGGCVNISGKGSQSYVDIRLHPADSYYDDRLVTTVLLYQPRDAAVADVKVTSTDNQTDLKPFSEIIVTGNGGYHVYLSQGNSIITSTIRVSAARRNQDLSICFMRVYDVTMEQYCDCRDKCNRNADVICSGHCREVDESKCNMVNVALNKPANMSSSHLGANASYAVNGITGTSFSADGYNIDVTLWNCIHTSSSDSSPNWTVDLKQPYTFQYITIYLRDVARDKMKGVRINVDGELCRVITKRDVRNEKMDLVCDTAMTGRHVTLTKGRVSLQFCELQIWVCKPGFYGTRCEEACSGHCGRGEACNAINGTCPGECEPGWYTAKCSVKCSPGCTAAACDKLSGECSECRDHFVGDRCDACDNDRFGDDCSKQCGHCLMRDRPCDRRTGNCEMRYGRRCDAGYQGLTCTEECRLDRYGKNCEQTCSRGCENNGCERIDGHCSCRPGWKGSNPKCTERCEPGTYGRNCIQRCGQGCANRNCDQETGFCSCIPGYQSPLCRSESDENNIDDDGCDDEGSVDKTTVIAASVVFFVIYISSIIIIIICFRRRRRGSDPSPASNVQGQPDVNDEVPQGVVNQDGCIKILPLAPI